MYVYFYLFARAGLARLDQSTLEAAQALGADGAASSAASCCPCYGRARRRRAAHVHDGARLVQRAVHLRRRFRVMTTQIYSTKVNGDVALAMVETLALALIAVAGLVLLRHTQGETLLAALGKVLHRGGGISGGRPCVGWPRRRAGCSPWCCSCPTSRCSWSRSSLRHLDHRGAPARAVVRELPPRPRRAGPPAPAAQLVLDGVGEYGRRRRHRARAGWLVVRRRVAVRRWIESFLELPWALPGTVFASRSPPPSA